MKVQFITPAMAVQYVIHNLNLQTCVESSRSFVYLTRYFFFLSFFISFFAFFEGWEKTIFKHGFRLIFPLRPFKVHFCLNAHARFLRSFDKQTLFFCLVMIRPQWREMFY